MTQSKTKIIGLTGGIATGKSTASKTLKEKGFKVIDADQIAKEVLNIGHPAYDKVVEFFGEQILNEDGTIDRKSLGIKIFKDKTLREQLNSITHPYIMKCIKGEIDKNIKEKILFLDIPLLLEVYESIVGSGILIDEVWLIYCSREEQIKRLMKRDQITSTSAKLKINAQIDIEKKRDMSDRIIDNSKDKEQLIENIEIELEKIS